MSRRAYWLALGWLAARACALLYAAQMLERLRDLAALTGHVALAAVTALAWLGAGSLVLRRARGRVNDRLLEG